MVLRLLCNQLMVVQFLLGAPILCSLFNRIENSEYYEYQEFKEPLKLVLAYLLERKYNDQMLIQIANKFTGTYFHDVVHNL